MNQPPLIATGLDKRTVLQRVIEARNAIEEAEKHERGQQAQIGIFIRQQREMVGVPLRRAAKAMGITPPYLSDLEHGRRRWSPLLVDKVYSALQSLTGHLS